MKTDANSILVELGADALRREFDGAVQNAKPKGGAGPAPRRAKEQRPIVFKSVRDFCAEFERPSYTVEGVLRSGSLYCLTAKTGAGKTAFNVVAALAVATGRTDILGREVTRGRVAYLACENPDDIRMRIMIAAYLLNVNLAEIGDRILVLDRKEPPEAVHAELSRLAKIEPFALIIVDTLAAFFDCDDINNAVQGGDFMRRLRPLTQIGGKPSVLVSAHPIKNASADALVPYGSGAILNEIDGNLTLWKSPESGLVSLHWQGKLRGLEFSSIHFRFEITGSPEIVDAKDRQVQLPTLLPNSEKSVEESERVEIESDRALLKAMIHAPDGTQQEWAAAIGRSKGRVNAKLQKLKNDKFVSVALGKWSVTEKARKALA